MDVTHLFHVVAIKLFCNLNYKHKLHSSLLWRTEIIVAADIVYSEEYKDTQVIKTDLFCQLFFR